MATEARSVLSRCKWALIICLPILTCSAFILLFMPETFAAYSCIRFRGTVSLGNYTIHPPLSWWLLKGDRGDIASVFKRSGRFKRVVLGDTRTGEMHFLIREIKGTSEERLNILRRLNHAKNGQAQAFTTIEVSGQRMNCIESKSAKVPVFVYIDCMPEGAGIGLVASYLGDESMSNEFLGTLKSVRMMK